MDETQRGSKPMGEATIRRCCTFKKPKPDRLVCRKSLKSANAESPYNALCYKADESADESKK
jgi:hypothetical protein